MMTLTTAELQERISAYLTEVTGTPATVEALSPLAGGASRDMWKLDARLGETSQQLVLRRDPPTEMFAGALSRRDEFAVMRAAHASGIHVAHPRWLCTDSSILGAPFFIMDFVPGISIGRKVISMPELATARALLPEQMAQELARIHQINPITHHLAFLPVPRSGHSPAQEAIAQCYELLESLRLDHPAFEFALRWAEQHAPASGRITFIHGDFRIGNLIVDETGLKAVADWEFSHMGDPCEELGYCCMRDWRFGSIHKRLGGIGNREPFLQAYESFSGERVDRQIVTYWEILGNIRWGIICLSQANRHLSGREPNIELASLGRRSAEMQYEMLHLIEMVR
jgi:aminoglycoside phosphotransferase (APT) family kinase protein